MKYPFNLGYKKIRFWDCVSLEKQGFCFEIVFPWKHPDLALSHTTICSYFYIINFTGFI